MKNSDWDNRLEAPQDSDEVDSDGENELTPEEKAAQVELEELRRKEAEDKEKYLEDVRKGRIVAHSTIQPVRLGIIKYILIHLIV